MRWHYPLLVFAVTTSASQSSLFNQEVTYLVPFDYRADLYLAAASKYTGHM